MTTCIRCSAPLGVPRHALVDAAWMSGDAAYCCAECADGKTCVCQLLSDPDRQPTSIVRGGA